MQSKYRAKQTVVDGIRFHSAKEAKRYGELKLLEKAEKISNLKLQPRIKCVVNGVKVCDYVADFYYIEKIDDRTFIDWYEDAKGFKTPIYRLKKKLVFALYGIVIKEV